MEEVEYTTGYQGNDTYQIEWHLKEGQRGKPYFVDRMSSASMDVFGNFGRAAAVIIKGSNSTKDMPEGRPLTDGQGNPLICTGPRLEQIAENVFQYYPEVVDGDQMTDIIIQMKFMITPPAPLKMRPRGV